MENKCKIVIKLNESENMALAICTRANTKQVASDPKFIPFVNSLIDTAIEGKIDTLSVLEKATLLDSKYSVQEAIQILTEVESLDADIQKSILEKFHKSEYLKQHRDLPKIVEAIRFIDFAVDLTGGNADDKTEVMIIEFDDNSNKTYRLEYIYMYNWSYDEHIVKLKLFDGQSQSTIINHKGHPHYVNTDAFALDKLMDLAEILNISYLDIRGFCYFLLILFSRMIQKDYFTDDENTLDEVLERHTFIWPVQNICEKANIDFTKTAISHIKNEIGK